MADAEGERVVAAAEDLLRRFLIPGQSALWPALAEGLRPRPGDFDRVFVGEAAARAREAYGPIWAGRPVPSPKPGATVVELWVAQAAELAAGAPIAEKFPGGYQAIGPLLVPDRWWVRWKFRAENDTAGMAYDGLVWLDDRFAWFPKPVRALGDRGAIN